MLSRSHLTTRRPAGFIDPCLPTLAHAVPDGPLWAHEIKHDGYRFICRWDGDRVRAFTRRGHDWRDRVPRIAEALAALPVTSATIDGEAVVCDSAGVSDFDRLRAALARRGSPEIFLYAFDLLELDGCGTIHGTSAVRRWQASCARPATASGCPSILRARMARPSFATPVHWASKASSPSDATGPTVRGVRRIGSR